MGCRSAHGQRALDSASTETDERLSISRRAIPAKASRSTGRQDRDRGSTGGSPRQAECSSCASIPWHHGPSFDGDGVVLDAPWFPDLVLEPSRKIVVAGTKSFDRESPDGGSISMGPSMSTSVCSESSASAMTTLPMHCAAGGREDRCGRRRGLGRSDQDMVIRLFGDPPIVPYARPGRQPRCECAGARLQPCTAPNSTHVASAHLASCRPPQAALHGSRPDHGPRHRLCPASDGAGNAATVPDEADIFVNATVTDVVCAGVVGCTLGADYTGRPPAPAAQLTDTANDGQRDGLHRFVRHPARVHGDRGAAGSTLLGRDHVRPVAPGSALEGKRSILKLVASSPRCGATTLWGPSHARRTAERRRERLRVPGLFAP